MQKILDVKAVNLTIKLNPYAYSQKDPIFYPKRSHFLPQKIRSFACSPSEFLNLPQALQPSSPLF